MEEEGVKTVTEQIDEMLNIGVEKPEEAPVEESPVEESPVEESVEEEPQEEQVEEEPPVEEPAKEAPAEEPKEEEEEEDELTILKRENEALRKSIDDLSGPKTEPKKEQDPEPESKPEPEPVKLDEIDFIGDADVDDITYNPKELNKILNKVYAQGIDTARKTLGEGVLRSIPDIVKANVATVISLRESSERFYEDNKDLKPFKKVVSAVFEEVAAENPDKKLDEILKDVEKETRKRLELYREAIKPDTKSDPKPPKLPKVKGQHRETSTKPNISPMQAEIDAMNELQF